VFLWVLFFYQRSFLAPCIFRGASFLSEVFFSLLYLLGCLFYHWRSLLAPCIFRDATFFIGGLLIAHALIYIRFEPMSERSDSAPSLVAFLFSLTTFVEYGANFASDFDLTDSVVLGQQSFYASLKTSLLHKLVL
jgi:hypothetical protein